MEVFTVSVKCNVEAESPDAAATIMYGQLIKRIMHLLGAKSLANKPVEGDGTSFTVEVEDVEEAIAEYALVELMMM